MKTFSDGTPANWLMQYLEGRGIFIKEICDGLELKESELMLDSGMMSISNYLNLLTWAAKRLDDPLFGAHVAGELTPREFGLLGHLVSNGPSVREVFDFIDRYNCIFAADFDYSFSNTDTRGICYYHEASVVGADNRIDIDFGLAIVSYILRAFAGDDWRPLKSSFSYPEPDNVEAYKEIFGDTLLFDQPQNSIEFELELLDLTNSHSDPGLLSILLSQANQLLDKLQEQEDIVHQVRLLITTSLGYKMITADRVAESLDVSVRQLHRLLSERDTSYRAIREETIIQVAKEALIESKLSVTEIALKLNYSEPSALDRMFKKQVGMTPIQYRKKYSGSVG